MAILYSASTRGFYDTDFDASRVPDDAVEILAEQREHLLSAERAGQVIVPDKLGWPVAIDRPPLSQEELQAQVNAEARNYLASTDWYVIRAQETGEPIPAEIVTARQAARDAVVV